jgi:hypothetical protein
MTQLDPNKMRDKWRAPIGSLAYIIITVIVSIAIVYVFAVRPQNHTINIASKAAILAQNQEEQIVAQQKTINAVISQLQAQAGVLSHQAIDRQNDTNAFAGAICTQRTRLLISVRDSRTPPVSAKASKKSADDLWKFLKQLSPHPPTKCKGVDPYP